MNLKLYKKLIMNKKLTYQDRKFKKKKNNGKWIFMIMSSNNKIKQMKILIYHQITKINQNKIKIIYKFITNNYNNSSMMRMKIKFNMKMKKNQ